LPFRLERTDAACHKAADVARTIPSIGDVVLAAFTNEARVTGTGKAVDTLRARPVDTWIGLAAFEAEFARRAAEADGAKARKSIGLAAAGAAILARIARANADSGLAV